MHSVSVRAGRAVAPERLRWRPVCPKDAPALRALYDGLSELDLRRRFHGAVNGLSDLALRRMTEGAAASSGLAFVVATEAPWAPWNCTLVADARCALDAEGDSAEFALLVAPAWRGRGLGRQCMQALCFAASQHGLRWLHGSVLADNLPMLALMRRCGFRCTDSRHDARLVEVERRVDRPDARHALRALAFELDAR